MMFQEVWNPVVLGFFLWFAGIAGMGSVAYVLMRLSKVEEKLKELSIVIFASIVLALVFVVADLSRPFNMPFAILQSLLSGTFIVKIFVSWMSFGISVLALLLLLSLLILLRHTFMPGLQKLTDQKWYLVLTGLIGFLVVIYSGFLIADAPGIPFWNNSLIPVLWIFSASVCAVAILKILVKNESITRFLTRAGLALEIGELVSLAALMNVSLYSGIEAAQESAAELLLGSLASAFWLFVVIIGVLVPLSLGFLLLKRENRNLALISAICGLIGALALRILVLWAGIPITVTL
jgi:formate-dependent nitrite reductase membrane component NrfD